MAEKRLYESTKAREFERFRSNLLGLAYRILGSVADAEDAVQETFIRWSSLQGDNISNSKAWLIKVCTRYCLDIHRAKKRSRIDYVGTWLPEPIVTAEHQSSSNDIELSSSLTTAFLMMLERLKPKERAAFLLREVFDVEYLDISETLRVTPAHCRKLVSRAKQNIDQDRIRHVTPVEKQQEFLMAFKQAVSQGEHSALTQLLASDVTLDADGGGKAASIIRPIVGSENVMDFITRKLTVYWKDNEWLPTSINQGQGVMLMKNGKLSAVVSVEFNQFDQVKSILVIRNPDKFIGVVEDKMLL